MKTVPNVVGLVMAGKGIGEGSYRKKKSNPCLRNDRKEPLVMGATRWVIS